MIRINRKSHGSGFTLIELLVVIAIISMLVGLLSPAIKVITRSAKGLKQKSTFHGYETGLELFAKDFDGYPDSSRIPNATGAPDQVTGAQHLAEALLGRDLRGFDPKSNWYAPTDPKEAYAKNGVNGADSDDEDKSLRRRKELYIEMKDDGAYSLADLYGDAGVPGSTGNVYSPSGFTTPRAPVLTDVFTRKRIEVPNPNPAIAPERIKVGSPVLYFRADQTSKKFSGSDPVEPYGKYIYNYNDNRAILNLGTVRDNTKKHNYDTNETITVDGKTFTGAQYFYYKIWNKRVDTYEKPVNPKTFLLISAGWDGKFGTKDDITNFDY